MNVRRSLAAAFGAAAILGSVIAAAPAHAQTYGGGTVDCYISSIDAPATLRSGETNTFIAHGGNHGNESGNCSVSGHISNNHGYNRDFRTVNLTVAKNGTFEVHFGDSASQPGTYTIQVCAHATGPDAINPADDCKSVTRSTGGGGGGGNVDCYISSISAPSQLHSGQSNTFVAKGGNHGTADGKCLVTGNIKRQGGGYSRTFKNRTLNVASGGTFQQNFGDSVEKTGKYTIQVCATAANGNDGNTSDNCKTITRNAV
jgi:hypothetical protein